MNREEFRAWCVKNAIGQKLRAAIENIEVGRGWDMFNGLETGETFVKVVYSGPVITIMSYKVVPKPQGIPGFEMPPNVSGPHNAVPVNVPESETEPKAPETPIKRPGEKQKRPRRA